METKKFFHQRHPRLDRFIHCLENDWERQCRHMEIEDPEAYKKMMDQVADRHEQQMAGMRRSGSTGLCG